MVFSIFLFLALVFIRVYTSSVSPMASFVNRINALVPNEQRRDFTAEFFRDPKNLEILNKTIKNDFLNVRRVLKYIHRSCFLFRYNPPEPDPLEVRNDELLSHFQSSVHDFKLENFVGDLAAFLETYNDYSQKGYITEGKKSIVEIFDLMISSLEKLNPNRWNKKFFAKLQKAFKNEDYQTGDETEKADDTNDKNDGVETFSDLPIAIVVDEIDKLITKDHKKNFIVEFFKDLKNLEILNQAVKNDFPNVQNVLINIWNTCLRFNAVAPSGDVILSDARLKKLHFDQDCGADEFTVENYIRDLEAFLEIYNYYLKNGKIKEGLKSIDEMVDPMIKSLKYLNPDNWDKEFFAKLQKAFNNEDYRTETKKVDGTSKKDEIKKDENSNGGENEDAKSKNPNDTGNKDDSKKDENKDNGGGNDLFYILAMILLILAVIGAVVFFVLRHRKQALPIV
jgi:hypothetical protein